MMDGLPKAVLLDLDDTILAFDSTAGDIWQAACSALSPNVDGYKRDDIVRGIRDYVKWYWSDPQRHRFGRLNPDVGHQMVSGAFQRLGIDAPSLALQIAEAYLAQREKNVVPLPGALDTLRSFRQHGVRLALITNGNAERQRHKVNKFGLAPYFDYILIEGEFGAGKPDQRVYLYALQQLGAQASEAWIVGDNLEWEVAAPQRLGIFSIWVDLAGAGLPESSPVRPDRIIRSLPELLPPNSWRP